MDLKVGIRRGAWELLRDLQGRFERAQREPRDVRFMLRLTRGEYAMIRAEADACARSMADLILNRAGIRKISSVEAGERRERNGRGTGPAEGGDSP